MSIWVEFPLVTMCTGRVFSMVTQPGCHAGTGGLEFPPCGGFYQRRQSQKATADIERKWYMMWIDVVWFNLNDIWHMVQNHDIWWHQSNDIWHKCDFRPFMKSLSDFSGAHCDAACGEAVATARPKQRVQSSLMVQAFWPWSFWEAPKCVGKLQRNDSWHHPLLN